MSRFIPDFGRYGKDGITIRQLLTHTSGLRPISSSRWNSTAPTKAIRRAIDEVPVAAPDERFVYSDINFFLLGDIVRRVSGERLDQYARAHIFEPLVDDGHDVPAARRRCARESRRPNAARSCAWPCTVRMTTDVPFLRGIVHDPTARRMDGVAGHAGLFSTAADLSRFCRMLLNGGTLDGVRILSPATVSRMIAPSTPAFMRDVRGLGWDIDSSYSANRGDLFPLGSFGHTGIHRYVALARSAVEELRRLSVESRASRRQGRRDRAARPGGDGRGCGAC